MNSRSSILSADSSMTRTATNMHVHIQHRLNSLNISEAVTHIMLTFVLTFTFTYDIISICIVFSSALWPTILINTLTKNIIFTPDYITYI